MEFEPFQKIARWSREIIVTEKIDGTNGQIFIPENATADMIQFGSRNQWLTERDHNYGFFKWGHEHREELLTLGAGRHYGEWWGLGIQRNYSQTVRRFSLFNTKLWADNPLRPACCEVTPVLYQGPLEDHGVTKGIKAALNRLQTEGSVAAPGFMKPEGVIIFHTASRQLFKKTLEKDEYHKGESA